jgi:lysine-ketoglutarate reductase/saccharopine dehydrogenase-like protein (TIGR00300 family)
MHLLVGVIMAFHLPPYRPPDFTRAPFAGAPLVIFRPVTQAGVAPPHFHATTIFPEYFHLRPGEWVLLRESRMDCVVVRRPPAALEAVEFRRLQVGDAVACGRGEQGEEGIHVDAEAFRETWDVAEKFVFRSRITRETSFSIDYDELYELLRYERDHGFILWVLGPAAVFDRDAREALVKIIEGGFMHGLLAGNALATHDIEGALFQTALGQELYTKRAVPQGHYRHLDALNTIRTVGSMEEAVRRGIIHEGVMHTVLKKGIPFVLAGSIRDDGPLPEVVADAYVAQDRMRALTRRATTVIALATQLHSIAVGNMLPCYQVAADGTVRPVYFTIVDMSEFATDKLANRGSLAARTILANVQDFVVHLERGLHQRCA